MDNKIYLCSFASDDLDLSVQRFKNQADNLNIYSQIKIFRPKDLNLNLQNRIKEIIKKKGPYLYGHAIWKCRIVKDYLLTLPENSILQYSDIGCHLNKEGIEKFKEYALLTERFKMLAFDYSDPTENLKKYDYNFQINMEYRFTKGDVFNFFNIDERSNIYNSPHIWSGSFFVTKSDFCFKILDQWENGCKNLNLLDNSISKAENHHDFIGMRGEQSLFSLVCKLNKVKTLSVSECEWAEGKDGSGRKWSHLKHYPILAKRDIKYGLIKRFFNRQKKNINRFLKKLN